MTEPFLGEASRSSSALVVSATRQSPASSSVRFSVERPIASR